MPAWGTWRSASIAGLAVVAALLVTGCGGDDDAPSKRRSVDVKAPDALVTDGVLTFCSDVAYPPMEFEGEDGIPTGADMEISERLAKLMKLDHRVVNMPFDDVLPALEAGKCDAVISSLTNTKERREQVAFVDYLRFGLSIMVPTANEYDIDGIADLDGRTVAVQAGTTSDDLLKERAASEREGPRIRGFAKDTDATAAVKDGTADAYLGDSPVVAYHIGEEALTYAFAGDPIDPEPIGIAVRKDDRAMRDAIQSGIDAMYEDGSMAKILKRWKLEDFAID